VILGSREDRLTAERIALRGGPMVSSWAGETSLPEALTILSKAHAVVTVDTGLMHLASALKRPVVALFGPTAEERTGPLGEQTRVLRASSSCAPCFKKHCDDNRCMMEIDPSLVMVELERFL